MVAALARTDFDGGDGGGPCDPRDVTIYIQDQQIAELRQVMRRLLDSDGEEAGEAIEAAEALLSGLDTVDAEDAAERDLEALHIATHCDCGTYKGAGTSYCPECDKDALERLKALPSHVNVVSLHCPF